MEIINNKTYKAIRAGKFCSKWYFEISKSTCGWDVEIKFAGYHLRWYPGKKFFFIRKETLNPIF